jgi:hypothetical protein
MVSLLLMMIEFPFFTRLFILALWNGIRPQKPSSRNQPLYEFDANTLYSLAQLIAFLALCPELIGQKKTNRRHLGTPWLENFQRI